MEEFWGAISEWLTGTSDMRQWDWGSAADYGTLIATVAAGAWVVALFQIENSTRRRDQADQIYFNVEVHSGRAEISIFNASSQRIVDPFFLVKETRSSRFAPHSGIFPNRKKWIDAKGREKEKSIDDQIKVQSMERVSYSFPYGGQAEENVEILSYLCAVAFKDVRGRYWLRRFRADTCKRLGRQSFYELKKEQHG
ncbi:hypothetical protein MT356_09470 [Rathayibacter festucae]|uniref:hypothetical protein n=1 Tax=Rathayibacter festucae TaxID=110937 RepID=UPI001FB22CF5|nr:hypothetical protein [Rathayibacter festucae]MCJ1699951.1 hypothetical protein [Rathayibacter festucae]